MTKREAMEKMQSPCPACTMMDNDDNFEVVLARSVKDDNGKGSAGEEGTTDTKGGADPALVGGISKLVATTLPKASRVDKSSCQAQNCW